MRAVEQLDRGRVLPHGQTDEPLEVETVDVAGALRQDALALLERLEEETFLDEGLGQRLARVDVVGLLVEVRQDRRHARSGLGRELLEPGVEVGGAGAGHRRRRLRRARRFVAHGPVEEGGHQRREQGSVGEADQARAPGARAARPRQRLPRAGSTRGGAAAPPVARVDLFEAPQRARRLQLEVPALGLAQLLAVAVAQPRRRSRSRLASRSARSSSRSPASSTAPAAARPPALICPPLARSQAHARQSRRAGRSPDTIEAGKERRPARRSRADLGAHPLDVARRARISTSSLRAARRPRSRRRLPPRVPRRGARAAQPQPR